MSTRIQPPEMDPYAFLDDLRYDIIDQQWVPLSAREITDREEQQIMRAEAREWHWAVTGGIALLVAGVLGVVAVMFS